VKVIVQYKQIPQAAEERPGAGSGWPPESPAPFGQGIALTIPVNSLPALEAILRFFP